MGNGTNTQHEYQLSSANRSRSAEQFFVPVMTTNTFPSPVVQTTSVQNRLPYVSFARGFAILTIVAYHLLQRVSLPAPWAGVSALGGAGIYVYLFLSGYGLALSTRTNWKIFWQKRFIKVLFPYYVVVTLIFGINIFLPLYKTDGWPEYLSHLFLYKMAINRYTDNLGEYLWFVATIVQFYLVMPLLFWWQDRSRTRWFVGSLCLISLIYSSVITGLGVAHLRIWYSFFLQYLWVFGFGMALARGNWLANWVARPGYVHATGAIAGFGLAWLIEKTAGPMGSVFNDPFLFVGYASVVLIMYRISLGWTGLRRFIRWVEPFSYSMYLTHVLVFQLYSYTTGWRPWGLVDAVLIGQLVVCGALLFQRGVDGLLWRTRRQAY